MTSEEGAIEEVAVVDAPVAEAPVADTEVVETPPAQTQKEEKQVPLRVMLERIGEERAKLQKEADRVAALEKRAADAEALAERLSRGDKTELPLPRPMTTDDAEIERRAAYHVFLRDVASLRERGVRDYGAAFNESIRALNAIGADNDAFIQQVLDVDPDKAHVMLSNLAQNLEHTASLVSMTPNRRIAELTRMAISAAAPVSAPEPAKPAPKAAVSKAPAPAPALQGSTTNSIDWRNDKASDEEFTRGFNEMLKNRMGRR